MEQYGFLIQLALAVIAALVGGLAARVLHLPAMAGYLIAGIIVGLNPTGVVAEGTVVQSVAKMGVALLMFAVGVQFSLKEVRAVRTTALVGGSAQILLCVFLGYLVGTALGWDAVTGIFLGCALALSSTAVMMRILEQRGELVSGHGSVMLGILVIQDLSVVVMVALLPVLRQWSGMDAQTLTNLGLSLLRAGLALGLVLVLAFRAVPVGLGWVARTGSRELFLLAVVSFCLTAALAAHLAGLSLEIGAFLAGIAISESHYAHEVLQQVRPLRDLFASLFFVSIGMLLDPILLWKEFPAVLVVVAAIILGKGLISSLAVYFTGWHGRTAIYAGLGLAQIGEFSFVLTAVGQRWKLVSSDVTGIIISAAIITILLAPIVYSSADKVYRWLARFPLLAIWMNRHHEEDTWEDLRDGPPARVIILGSGRIGKHVSDALRSRAIPHVVVDYNTKVVKRRREMGVRVVYGDASSDIVLAKTNPEDAELAVVTLPDPEAASAAVKNLKRLAPNISVLVRVHKGAEMIRVREAGANSVVHAEFEAAAEIVRRSLERLEVPEEEIVDYIDQIRMRRYMYHTPYAPEMRPLTQTEEAPAAG